MKINYVAKVNEQIKLKDIKTGELFRPTDSRDVYIRTSVRGDDNLLTNSFNSLWNSTANGYEGDPFDSKDDFEDKCNYEDLIVCVDIESGDIWLLHQDVCVEKLKSELTIEE